TTPKAVGDIHRKTKGKHLHKPGQHRRIDRRVSQVGMHTSDFSQVPCLDRIIEILFDLIFLLQQVDTQRPYEESLITSSFRKIASELPRIHCLLRRHILESAQVIAETKQKHSHHAEENPRYP